MTLSRGQCSFTEMTMSLHAVVIGSLLEVKLFGTLNLVQTKVFGVLASLFDVTFCKIHNLITVNFYAKNLTDLKS